MYPPNGQPLPATFLQYGLMGGMFKVTCADGPSLEWLIGAGGKIESLNDLSFEFLRHNEIPKLHKCVAFFPRKKAKDGNLIRERLQRSNPSFDIMQKWKCIWSKEQGNGLLMCMGIDAQSAKKLRELDSKPFFELGRIQFTIKDDSQNKTQTLNTKTAETISADLEPQN